MSGCWIISGLLSFSSCLTSHTELICCLWFPLLWARDLICLFSAAAGRHLNTCRWVFIWTLGKTLFTSCQCVSVSEDICLLQPGNCRLKSTSQVVWLPSHSNFSATKPPLLASRVTVTTRLDVSSAHLFTSSYLGMCSTAYFLFFRGTVWFSASFLLHRRNLSWLKTGKLVWCCRDTLSTERCSSSPRVSGIWKKAGNQRQSSFD